MNKFDYLDEVAPYKKKSQSKPPKKSKHKHLCEPCIISYPMDWWTKEHLRSNKRNDTIGVYCPICGKIGDIKDRSRWYTNDTVFIGNMRFTESVLTEDGKREMNPETRTLPYFEVDDPFDKFVSIEGDGVCE